VPKNWAAVKSSTPDPVATPNTTGRVGSAVNTSGSARLPEESFACVAPVGSPSV
jgi:hypothetical protein